MTTEIKKYDINSINEAYNSYLNTLKDKADKSAQGLFDRFFKSLETTKKELKEEQDIYNKLKEEQDENNKQLDKIATELKDFKAQKDNAEENISKLTDKEEIKRTNDLIDELNKKIESWSAQANTLDKEISYNEDLLKLHDEKIKKLTADVKELTENSTKAKTDLKASKDKKVESYDSLENFIAFLKQNNLSTVHADTLHKLTLNPNKNITFEKNEFTMRKMHPKRDFMIKKVAIPATIVGTVSGSVAGAVATSGAVAGATSGFMPVFSSVAMNIIPSIALGFAIGAGITVATIATTKAIVKKAHKINAKKDLENLKNNTNIESLKITELINKIEKDNHKILELKEKSGNIFTRAFKKVRRHAINAWNRDRLHALADYTKELVELYNIYSNDQSSDAALTAKKLKPINDILSKINNFISSDIKQSKVFALTTCEESSENHSHVNMIENIDIYAGLKIYLDRVKGTEEKAEKKTQVKIAKRTVKNLTEKKNVATTILNDSDRLIGQMTDFNKNYSKFVNADPNSVAVIKTDINNDSTITYTLPDNQTVTLTLDQVSADKALKVTNIKKTSSQTVITYEDKTTKIIKTSSPKTEPDEYYVSRNLLLEKLSSEDFIKELKDAGYIFRKQTIEKVMTAITDWKESDNQKLRLTGNAKKLYEVATKLLKGEKIEVQEEENVNNV